MKGSKNGGVRTFILGAGTAAVALLVCSLIAAAIAYSDSDPTGKIGIYSLAALIISAAIGGSVTSRLTGDGGVRYAALTSLTVVMVMLLCAVITGGGSPKLSALMNYLCYLGVSVGAAHLARPRKRRHKRR
jgi:peptidoglycan/LPS O-acetylase OafA/YrhL